MLRKLRADGSHRRAHLVYGVSTDEDLVELETLAEVATGLPGFTWDYCVADPASSAPNKGPEKAYVMSLIRPEHLYDGDVAIYLCGPPPMVEAVRKHVAEAASSRPASTMRSSRSPSPRRRRRNPLRRNRSRPRRARSCWWPPTPAR